MSSELLKQGGKWLAACRTWMQRKCINGSSVTWGSDEVLRPPITVRRAEEMCASAVAAERARGDEESGFRRQLLVEKNQLQMDLQRAEAKLKAHEENEGPECPLCQEEARAELAESNYRELRGLVEEELFTADYGLDTDEAISFLRATLMMHDI